MKAKRKDIPIHIALIAIAAMTLLPFVFVVNNAMRRTTEQYHSFFGVPAALKTLDFQALTRGFVHRDYPSRNLMDVKERDGRLGLGWIEFQDALLGPRVYDLVALLGDSYQSFDPEFVAARLSEFGAGLGLSPAEQPELEREFSLVMVQRKLKDSGRFVYLDRELKNPSFLKFVEPTIQKAQRALDRLTAEPRLAALSALLERLFDRSGFR
jgi:aminoglycoside/choline kinase family phosphotransferase